MSDKHVGIPVFAQNDMTAWGIREGRKAIATPIRRREDAVNYFVQLQTGFRGFLLGSAPFA